MTDRRQSTDPFYRFFSVTVSPKLWDTVTDVCPEGDDHYYCNGSLLSSFNELRCPGNSFQINFSYVSSEVVILCDLNLD